jgi:hypothetical protein
MDSLPQPASLSTPISTYPGFFYSELSLLKPEARCLVRDLQDWTNALNGIENTEETLVLIARRMGFTRGKFLKLWPLVHGFFVVSHGRICAKAYGGAYGQPHGEAHGEIETLPCESGAEMPAPFIVPKREKSKQHRLAALKMHQNRREKRQRDAHGRYVVSHGAYGVTSHGPHSSLVPPPQGSFSYTPPREASQTTAALEKTTHFPETAAAVQKFFPETDLDIVAQIVQVAHVDHPHATDTQIAAAVIQAHERDQWTQRKAVLFKSTVPGMLRKISAEAHRKPPRSEEYSIRPTQCNFCGDTGYETSENSEGISYAKICRCRKVKAAQA